MTSAFSFGASCDVRLQILHGRKQSRWNRRRFRQKIPNAAETVRPPRPIVCATIDYAPLSRSYSSRGRLALFGRFIQDERVWLLRGVVLILLGGVFALMSFRGPLTLIQSRVIEVFVFFLLAVALAMLSWHAMAEALASGDAVAFKIAQKNHIIGVMILIFAYASFVPNSCRAAAWILLPLAVSPLAIKRAFLATHSVRQQFPYDEVFEAGWNLMTLLIVAGLIHRDLAPDNIYATQIGTRYDVAKILDFGLAHLHI